MDDAERRIYHYVKSLRPNAVPARDISRTAGSKRRFRCNPEWANPVLLRMTERGILETDAQGSYRLKPIPPEALAGKHWVTPQLAQILRASRKDFEGLIMPEDADDYYDKL